MRYQVDVDSAVWKIIDGDQLILKEMAANAVAMAHGRFAWRHSVDVAQKCLAELLPQTGNA